jgi:hypothetical protein
MPTRNKRRIYQWIEYTGAIYRFPVTCTLWLHYFGLSLFSPMAMLYIVAKVYFSSDSEYAIQNGIFGNCYLYITQFDDFKCMPNKNFQLPFMIGLSRLWLRTTWHLFAHGHLGMKPTDAELRNEEPCSICHCDFTAPIKLNCGHIFCTEV